MFRAVGLSRSDCFALMKLLNTARREAEKLSNTDTVAAIDVLRAWIDELPAMKMRAV